MSAERVTFAGAAGQQLTGRIEWPLDGRPVGFALFAHCFTCARDVRAAVHLSRALSREGIATLRFDFTGLADNETDDAESGVSGSADDLVAAAEYLAAQQEAPKILVGHSLGGAAVLRAAERIPSAVAVATIGAPASPDHVSRLLGDPEARADAADEAEAEAMRTAVRGLRRPLLILHAPRDEVVGIENAAEIFQAAIHPKSFISLDRADHLLTDERDARYAGSMIAAWAARYLETPTAATVEELLAEPGVVTRTGEEGYRTEVRARHHALIVDEPAALGGTDTGPTPYDLLAAALGTCTSITLRMYADRKGWPLEEAVVRLEHSRIHALDEEECEHREPRMDRLDRILELRGALSSDQRARLREIADRCPVHRTLEAGVRVDTRLAE